MSGAAIAQAAVRALAERISADPAGRPDAEAADALHRLNFADPGAAWPLLLESQAILARPDQLAVLLSTLAALPEPGRNLLRFVRIAGSAEAKAARRRLSRDGRALEFLLRLFALAPGLAEILAARPVLLPGLLAGELWPGDAAAPSLPPAADSLDAAISACRRWLNQRRLGLGAAIIAGERDAGEAGACYTGLAEAVVQQLLSAVQQEFRRRHGTVAEARFAVFALGKLGGREMTAGSDLDLVLVFDAPDLHRPSDGAQPLIAGVYFRRLCNAVLAALSERQGAEALYEIDVRLSPWARTAAAATGFESFRRYYAGDAWTWERMALTRGRAIAGDAGLRAALEAAARTVLSAPRDGARLLRDVDQMRRRIARHHRPEGPWDVKRRPGGLVDAEFVAQYLMLREAPARPEVLAVGTADAAQRLAAAGALTAAESKLLATAVRLWLRLSCLARLTEGATTAEAERKRLIAESAGTNLEALEGEIEATGGGVRALYERLIARPAAAA